MIKETYDPSKPRTMKFKGIFLVSERKNGNDRVYPHDLLKREVDRFRTEMIDTNRALMELEHNSDSEIHPDRASARTLSLTEGNDVYGDVDYPKTEYSILGDIVCHKDGKITVYMGKPTAHEEEVNRVEEENAQLLSENLTGETAPDLPDPGTDENTDPAPDTGNESGSETDPTVNPSGDPGTTTE